MWWKPAPRYAQTTIPCAQCKKPLIARRSCHHAYLECENCKKNYEIQEYVKVMDTALEDFLEAVNCDRV